MVNHLKIVKLCWVSSALQQCLLGKEEEMKLLLVLNPQKAALFFQPLKTKLERKKRKKRYEEWDAKGGFHIKSNPSSNLLSAKTITHVSMARVLEVEPGNARTSPMETKGDCNLKRSKSTSSPSPADTQEEVNGNKGMELHFSLVVSLEDDNPQRDVVDPT